MRRAAIHTAAMMFAGLAILLATEGGASARSAGLIASSHPQLGNQGSAVATSASVRGQRWGYGRGWCYWHPYACYRAQ